MTALSSGTLSQTPNFTDFSAFHHGRRQFVNLVRPLQVHHNYRDAERRAVCPWQPKLFIQPTFISVPPMPRGSLPNDVQEENQWKTGYPGLRLLKRLKYAIHGVTLSWETHLQSTEVLWWDVTGQYTQIAPPRTSTDVCCEWSVRRLLSVVEYKRSKLIPGRQGLSVVEYIRSLAVTCYTVSPHDT